MQRDKPLRTTEKYLLAEILVLGNISAERHERLTNFSKTVFTKTLSRLESRGVLDKTIYRYDI